MNRSAIERARRDAMRVVALCDAADEELRRCLLTSYCVGTKTSGALRRASLDLTRSLAEMRKA